MAERNHKGTRAARIYTTRTLLCAYNAIIRIHVQRTVKHQTEPLAPHNMRFNTAAPLHEFRISCRTVIRIYITKRRRVISLQLKYALIQK